MLGPVVATLMSVSIGAGGGALFAVLHAPLPWTLGSISGSALAAIMGNRWPIPMVMRSLARPVVGVLAGSAFTPHVFGQLGSWWNALLFLSVFSLATSLAGYFIFRKVVRLDPVTSYFAAAPGGLGELSLLGGSLGGHMPTLVLVHATRIITMVFAIPIVLQMAYGYQTNGMVRAATAGALQTTDWLLLVAAGLAGYVTGRFKWFPGGSMVAAMLYSGVIHSLGVVDGRPPGWLFILVQILIGCVVGARFAGITWLKARLDLLVALVWSAALLGAAIVAAHIASGPMGVPFKTLLLAIAPGGSTEMIIISYAVEGDVAFVAFCQVVRVFLVLAVVPPFFNLIARWRERSGGDGV
jgi:uncharacterized protein